ncbi:MAG: ATP-binding protein [Labilithrix sp.]|nr:ATP-binding protein [Labilithrix sp.]MCW5815800.1 ATP-binding protein [Labilithrix sp.]
MAESVVGREVERALLDAMLASKEAELIAIYGRRRVGKTFLIREWVEPKADVFLTVTGLKDAPAAEQLLLFQREVERVLFDNAPLPPFPSWKVAFETMAAGLERAAKDKKNRKLVVFLDELPWLATRRSRLVQALDHTWNTRLSRIPSLRMILCGSAAAWMVNELVHAKGGLYNRITRRIHLQPFTLRETKAFLVSRGLRPKPLDVVDLYMAVGGVPHYLKQMEPGRSAQENVAYACFSEHGLLRDEYQRLFASLFDEPEEHEAIVRAVAKRRAGVTRIEILESTGLSSGGRFASRLAELEQAGFLSSLRPYQARTKNTLYRLTDEYCWFYLTWIEAAPKGAFARGGRDYWLTKSRSRGFESWAGYAFEGIVLKHAAELRRALGIDAVPCEIASFRHVPKSRSAATEGAQIDVLFDRADDSINVCELKYGREPYVVTKAYARELQTKLEVFERVTKTRKKIILTLVSPRGLVDNAWSRGLVERVVTIDPLMGL